MSNLTTDSSVSSAASGSVLYIIIPADAVTFAELPRDWGVTWHVANKAHVIGYSRDPKFASADQAIRRDYSDGIQTMLELALRVTGITVVIEGDPANLGAQKVRPLPEAERPTVQVLRQSIIAAVARYGADEQPPKPSSPIAAAITAVTATMGLLLSLSAVPAELRDRPQWIAWRYEQLDGRPKPAKMPYRAPGQRADTTSPATWLPFTDAVALAEGHGFSGVGFVFSKDDPYAGIDYDNSRNPENGAMKGWASAIIEDVGSYTEGSPSGKGAHSIVRGRLPDDARHKMKYHDGELEIYDRDRYFTFTGKVLDGRAAIIGNQAAVDRVVALFPPPAVPTASGTGAALRAEVSNDDLISQIAGSKDAQAYHRLAVAGESRPHHSSSEDDFELACLLARWVGNDPDRIARLMRASPLVRDKWDRADYLSRTIATAIHKAAASRGTEAAPVVVSIAMNGPRTFAEVAAARRGRPPREWLEPHVLTFGAGSLLSALPKMGKSTYAARLAVDAARRGERVLWADFEMGEDLTNDFLAEAGAGELGDRGGQITQWSTLRAGSATQDEIIRLLDGLSITVLVIDSWRAYTYGIIAKESDNATIRQEAQWLVNLAHHRPKLAVLVLHHLRKEPGEHGLDIGGGADLFASFDIAVNMYPKSTKTADTRRKLQVRGRFGLHERLVERQTEGTYREHEVKDDAAGNGKDPWTTKRLGVWRAVYDLTVKNGTKEFGVREVARVAHVSPSTASDTLNQLRSEQIVDQDTDGEKYWMTPHGRQVTETRHFDWKDTVERETKQTWA